MREYFEYFLVFLVAGFISIITYKSLTALDNFNKVCELYIENNTFKDK